MNEWFNGERKELSDSMGRNQFRGRRRFLRVGGISLLLIALGGGTILFYSLLGIPPRSLESAVEATPTPASVSSAKEQEPLRRRSQVRLFLPSGEVLLLESNQEPNRNSEGVMYGLRDATCRDAKGQLSEEKLREIGCFKGKENYNFTNLFVLSTTFESTPP